MKDKRKPGQSQLDYLWVNYGEFSVSTEPSDDTDVILTQGAINSILQNFSGISSVEVVEQEGNKVLKVVTSDGKISTYPFPSSITIQSFTKRQITQADRNKGCELPLGTWVYAILLSDGNEYLAPIDKYIGKSSESIIIDVIENSIYAELKISNRPSIVSLGVYGDGISADLDLSSKVGGVVFEKKDDGLSGEVVLQNSDKVIRFSLLTSEEYSDLVEADLVDDTTMYFIKGSKYFYFGLYKMGGTSGSVELDDYYTKQEIDSKLRSYATKDYVQSAIDAAKDAVVGEDTDTATSNTVHGAKAYAASLASNYATAAQGKKADSALQSITKGTDGSYVTTTVGAKSNNSQTIATSVTVQAINSASSTAKGLAEANDVKTYVDALFAWGRTLIKKKN